jgi:pimeloyl-ACP methyl ester carboxylesterase
MFRELIPLLADRFHVVAPDYPGFGHSAAPAPDQFAYTFDHLADVIERFVEALGLTRYSLYLQDYGGPVGLRLATRHPERVEALIVQNANAYVEGLSAAFDPLKPFWAHRTAETEEAARALLTRDATIFQYTYGVRDRMRVSPDAWTVDQHFLDRPGNDAIQLDLLHGYSSNLALYPAWHAYFRARRPRTLIVWGRNDPFFTVAGAQAYLRDLPEAELHLLDTGHFALEEDHDAIAAHIRRFMLG